MVLGGAVRLTGAGLSMVDWQPFSGILPPLNDAEWQQAFQNYQRFPEYSLVNPDMTLAGYQFIFWMEYAHRLLGRVTGIVFFVPFLFFCWRGMVPHGFVSRLWGLFLLGAVQGLLGWYMVKSGLADDPTVSHYRLAAHFMLAVVIYACLLRVIVGLRAWLAVANTNPMITPAIAINAVSNIAARTALGMVFLMMMSGALVAGTHAGHVYNTWPKMGGLWIPESLLWMQPWWLNFLENPIAIQFTHRWLAVGVFIAASVFAVRLIRIARPIAGGILLVAVAAQIALGIATLLLGVPLVLGVAHQAGAMILLTVLVITLANPSPRLS